MGKKVTRTECYATGGKWELKKDPKAPRRKGECTFEPGITLEEIGMQEMKWDANINNFFIKYNKYIRSGKKDDDFKKFEESYEYALKVPNLDSIIVDDETYNKYLDAFIEYMNEIIRLKGCVQCAEGRTETVNFIIDKLNTSIKGSTNYIKTKKMKYLIQTIYDGTYFQHVLPKVELKRRKKRRRD